MAQRTDHPPSTDDSASRTAVRRAIIGGAAGLALLVGPVVLANIVVPDEGQDRVEAAAESDSQTSLVALRRSATEADLAKANAALSLRTTTTPPPPPPTEPPPPPTEPPTRRSTATGCWGSNRRPSWTRPR